MQRIPGFGVRETSPNGRVYHVDKGEMDIHPTVIPGKANNVNIMKNELKNQSKF